jgi:glycosyltransferase involved in cell wall biosynthesis
MDNNWDLIEQNEASKNANGGTELFMRFLYGGGIPRELLLESQIIPSRVRDLKEDKVRILTLHDLPEDPESQKLIDSNYRDKFHKFVFISNWQYQQFVNKLNYPYNIKSVVIENGLKPIDVNFEEKPDPNDTVHIAYMTTPHRGLAILFPVFEKLAEQDKNIHLHVHSSFKMYGWEDADKQFEELFDKCRNHPQITYHGYTEFYQLREMMKGYHICAYPSIWLETACRQVLEAMSAGMLCVHPNYGALFDTTGGMNYMYDGSSDPNEHANAFMAHLFSAIAAIRNGGEPVKMRLMFNKSYVDTRYSPEYALMKWTNLLRSLTEEYQTVDSRKFPKPQFVYRTS